MTAFSHCSFKYGFVLNIMYTEYWIIKEKHPSPDIYQNCITDEDQ